MTIWLNDWKEDGLFQMIMDFENVYMTKSEYESPTDPYKNEEYWLKNKKQADEALKLEKYKDIDILLASYTYENYSGDAFVLFRKNGKLYEVNGSHCSCYGLGEESIGGSESQWQPEETTIESLKHRLKNGNFDGHFSNELKELVENL